MDVFPVEFTLVIYSYNVCYNNIKYIIIFYEEQIQHKFQY